jgi:deoxyribodipyrimidine photo-lyase
MSQAPDRIPTVRIRRVNGRDVNPAARHVLYWMTAFRRARFNFALQRAVEHAVALRKPLLVLEALRCDYPWASERLHRFILEGMVANARHFERFPVHYLSYVEDEAGAGKGLLEALAHDACIVVTDDAPVFFLPHMLSAAEARLAVRLEAVDSVGILPLRATERVFATAHSFRRFLHQELTTHLQQLPVPDPLAGVTLPSLSPLPRRFRERWPAPNPDVLEGGSLRALPIDHAVAPVPLEGGSEAAGRRLAAFVADLLPAYHAARNDVSRGATSGLSPYLHFGHISPHEVLQAVAAAEEWSPDRLTARANGKRTGWWGMGAGAEAFLDQLVTWRELGLNFASKRDDDRQWSSLPPWARATLTAHVSDPRPYVYSLERLEAADTHDPLWNAAQGQLLRDGTIHGYLRMLWGKKILEWSASPQEALHVMLELNDRWALDGRDPNSASGVCWCLGRYDRPWGPERAVFGTVRYMSSASTARKMRVADYVRTYAR